MKKTSLSLCLFLSFIFILLLVGCGGDDATLDYETESGDDSTVEEEAISPDVEASSDREQEYSSEPSVESEDLSEPEEIPTLNTEEESEKITEAETETKIFPESIRLDKESVRLNIGEHIELSATILPRSATERALTWISSDSNVATVAEGVVTAMQAGTATITVTTVNGKQVSCEVTVLVDGISFKSLEVKGLNASGRVSYHTEAYSFADEVGVSGNSTFCVYADEECTRTISSDTVSLVVGNNEFYIVEYIGDRAENRYHVSIYRRAMRKVSFDSAGGSAIADQLVEEDGFLSVEAPERKGYTFSGWTVDFEQPITEDVTAVAQWTRKRYTVTFIADGGDIKETTLSVEYDQPYVLEVPGKTGYIFEGWFINNTKMEKEGVWTLDGDVTLRAKWRSGKCTVTYDANGGSVLKPSSEVTYGRSYILLVPVRADYEFLGWFYGDQKIELKGNWMIGEDVVLTARWAKTPIDE